MPGKEIIMKLWYNGKSPAVVTETTELTGNIF